MNRYKVLLLDTAPNYDDVAAKIEAVLNAEREFDFRSAIELSFNRTALILERKKNHNGNKR